MKNIYKKRKNIYITEDVKIKTRGWYIYDNEIYCNSIDEIHSLNTNVFKKIILTTDKDLIADGVQAIDDEFLEWFVKNPSCESVEVKCYSKFNDGDFTDYKIIIPKEEPKQETLEEVKPPIGKFIIDNAVSIQGTDGAYYHYSEVCKLLRLQQEQNKNMYSEEEVKELLYKLMNYNPLNKELDNWFEKNKKK
jgi:hypothetical protein